RLCIHHLFCFVKVLRVPEDNPLAWQTSLLDSEIEVVLAGRLTAGNGRDSGGGSGDGGDGKHSFLRRDAKAKAAGRSGAGDSGTSSSSSVSRQPLSLGEVCSVCQEGMAGDDCGEHAALTYCSGGCGGNLHARCMRMYAEHRRSGRQKVTCPLCRADWVAPVEKERRRRRRRVRHHDGTVADRDETGDGNGIGSGSGGGGGVVSSDAEMNCASCRSTFAPELSRYRCAICTVQRDVCRRCFTDLRVGAMCIEQNHAFVTARAGGGERSAWQSAPFPPCSSISDAGSRYRGGGSASQLRWLRPLQAQRPSPQLLALQGRELSTDDYDLLLQLDIRGGAARPLHQHLLAMLPSHVGSGGGSSGSGGGSSGSGGGGVVVRAMQRR
ncbi:unnamed protein product, partial [Phaeothamnion confervicola]